MISLFRNIVRTIIFILSIYLVYVYLYRKQIDAIGLVLVLLVMSIIFAGTFVISSKENSKRIGGNGMPSYVRNPGILFMAMGSLLFITGISSILTGKVLALGIFSSRLIDVHDDKFMYWLSVSFHFLTAFSIFFTGWIIKRKGR